MDIKFVDIFKRDNCSILEAVGDKCKELKDEVGAMVKRQSMKLSDTFNSGLAEVTAMVVSS